MTHIVEEHRWQLDPALEQLQQSMVNIKLDDESVSINDLASYAIIRLLLNINSTKGNESIDHIVSSIGTLEYAKLEINRQLAAAMEVQKSHDNGSIDVSDDGEVLDEVTIMQPAPVETSELPEEELLEAEVDMDALNIPPSTSEALAALNPPNKHVHSVEPYTTVQKVDVSKGVTEAQALFTPPSIKRADRRD